jgi:hypothetical protein
MGYLIESSFGLQKIEATIPAADMQTLGTTPYIIFTQKTGFQFVPTVIYIQFDGTTDYDTFDHAYIGSAGPGDGILASFGRFQANTFSVGTVSSFIVNINHGTYPTNVFGSTTSSVRPYLKLSMNADDASGDGNGYLTMYGYYVPNI